MGMAASQARYLALTARKTNTEYEGQQINQARTALANQSANLFNRLLDLEVPVAPKTTDFTELQYSYSDGTNESVIGSWEQLSSADPNYNYVVNHYYYANVYTGSQKLLNDPQVTTRKELSLIDFKDLNPIVNINSDGTCEIITDYGTQTYQAIDGIYPRDEVLDGALADLAEVKTELIKDGVIDTTGIYGYPDSSGTWHFFLESEIEEPKDYSTVVKPAFVGNCELTELKDELSDEVIAELAQIIRDCPQDENNNYPINNMHNYLSITSENRLEYTGEGIYSFKMNGVTYYTTKEDLLYSTENQYEPVKPIEMQAQLPYYNASYVKTKIEETNQALLQTDENGRFTSVKFDDDSVVYTLNTETVTDEAAYQDAMNEYNYKVQLYEKTIADINARTSIIQEQDRTLELRLKQLDTEQNALKTEMEAVKKVISENVESTFKTFSD